MELERKLRVENVEDIYIFLMVERKSRGFQISSFLWISNLVRRLYFYFIDQRGNDLGAKTGPRRNSTILGVCSTPAAVREAPGDPGSSRAQSVSWTLIMKPWRGQNMAKNQRGKLRAVAWCKELVKHDIWATCAHSWKNGMCLEQLARKKTLAMPFWIEGNELDTSRGLSPCPLL